MADDGQRREDSGALREGYERLREAVLSGSAGGWRLGHGVLSARGMTGWMETFSEFASPADATATSAALSDRCPSPAGRPEPLLDADQVVAVLAQMVLPLAA